MMRHCGTKALRRDTRIDSMNPLSTHYPPTVATPTQPLRRVLAVSDVAAVALAWSLVLVSVWLREPSAYRVSLLSAWLLVATGVTGMVLSREQLYLARVLSIRAVEVQRLGRTCLIAALLLAGVDWAIGAPLGSILVGAGSLTSYALLLLSRAAVQARRHEQRRRRDKGRALLVVSEPTDARRTLDLLHERPELGYRVLGCISSRRAPDDIGVPWLGTPADLALVVQLTAATGVLIVAGALDPQALSATVSNLRALDVHVHLVVDDTDHRPSIRVLPLLHNSTRTVKAPALSVWQRLFKRAFDVVAGMLLTVVAAPVVMLAAGLLKVTAGGPVLVRDVRLDPGGEPLIVTRLRTRHLPPRRLARLVAGACRRLCIDELPQLCNVLTGSMSLVGPRPHHPNRDNKQAQAPTGMSAGLIGLRHVEARDYPEHGPHRRLDHFYAENWSIGLDFSILAASAAHLLWRTARQMLRSDEHAMVG
jgi:lipopolysaccharide/colanic/teichoic acid biosynthesis glycosyltransferase